MTALPFQPPSASPLAITLRPYQQEAVEALYTWFGANDGNPLIVVPTGGGKSLVIAAFVHSVLTQWPTERIVVLTHVRELIDQNYKQLLRAWPDAPAGIYSAGLGRREHDARVLFAGIQSVYDKAEKIGWADIVIIDECFVKGTMVETPSGAVAIEDIREGDLVFNATGVGCVEARSERLASKLYDVETESGNRIRCTGNHPFFTSRGWVRASELGIGEILFSPEDVRALWGSVCPMEEDSRGWEREGDEREAVGEAGVLLAILREEASKPHELQSSSRTGSRDASEDQAQADPHGRERPSIATSATRSAPRSRRWLGVGSGDPNRRAWAWSPDQLQDRHREQPRNAGDRTGRRVAQQHREARAGRPKGSIPQGQRVARVSRAEQRGPQAVFNLRVGGHPSFFAGGVLVHNCHLIPKSGMGMYRELLDSLRSMNSKLKLIGLTATPFRTGEGSLDKGEDRLFHGTAYSCDILRLIADGYLSPVTCKATDAQIDTTGLHVRMGDYVEAELEQAAMVGGLIHRQVDEIVKRGSNRKAWLVFCCSVTHAKAVATEIASRGITCSTVFGETGKDERDAVVAGFRAGTIRSVVNVAVLTTGFDAPHIDLVVLLRPTQSAVLYVQMTGRGLRLAPGKTNCIVLDFGGNVLRHGPIDQIKIREPRKGEKLAAMARECPMCQTLVSVATRVCPECGYEWAVDDAEAGSQLAETPADAEILSIGEKPSPIVRWDIQRVTYRLHQPKTPTKRRTLRVEYEAGYTERVSEFVCFDHDDGSFPYRKACAWWKTHGGSEPFPGSCFEAIGRQSELLGAESVTVDTRGEWPEIIGIKLRPRVTREPGDEDDIEPSEHANDVDLSDLPF